MKNFTGKGKGVFLITLSGLGLTGLLIFSPILYVGGLFTASIIVGGLLALIYVLFLLGKDSYIGNNSLIIKPQDKSTNIFSSFAADIALFIFFWIIWQIVILFLTKEPWHFLILSIIFTLISVLILKNHLLIAYKIHKLPKKWKYIFAVTIFIIVCIVFDNGGTEAWMIIGGILSAIILIIDFFKSMPPKKSGN